MPQLKKFRHTAETPFGTFRTDFFGRRYPYAVVYCGWTALPEATQRRMKEQEGICYAWAHDEAGAQDLVVAAKAAGLANVIVAPAHVRELP